MDSKDEKELLAFFDEKKPYKITCGPTVYVDVDDTLLMWSLPEGIETNDDRLITVRCREYSERLFPNEHNILLLKRLATRGHAIVVWSGGGADWAEAAVNALGLNRYVEAVSGKPQYYIDDISNPKEWIGKHGYFDIHGNKIHGDNIPDKKKE